MKKVLFLSNIPAPYRIDFFNELGKYCDLTVVFEAKRATGIRFNWNEDTCDRFRAVFLNEGDIDETHVDRRMMEYVKPGAYDRIVATSYGYYTETAALLKMRLLGIPYDIELDGGVLRERENPVKRLLKQYIIRGAGRLFSSGTATDALFIHYGADKARLVRYPFTSLFERDLLKAVPTDGEKAAGKAALGLPENRKVILTVSQFIHRKGVDVLLSGAGGLEKDALVLIVGGEPTEEYRAIVAREGLANVRFLPFMEKEVLQKYFLAADLFVLPTREDVWGLVVNEAMANALPVVTTEGCVAGRELVREGQNGFLVPIEDPAALTERMNRLIREDGLRRTFARNALETAGTYTIENMVRVHLDALGMDETEET